MKINNNEKYIDGFINAFCDILYHPLVLSMNKYNHHGKISTLFHSTFVAFNIYKRCIKSEMSEDKAREITSAAMLHDFYLYDWPTQKHDENHIFYHPKESIKNIEKTNIINLTEMQKQMILRHMFPCAKFPCSKGGWMLTTADKICATTEIIVGEKCFKEIFDVIYEGKLND